LEIKYAGNPRRQKRAAVIPNFRVVTPDSIVLSGEVLRKKSTSGKVLFRRIRRSFSSNETYH